MKPGGLQPDLAVFDLDGTLVDSTADIAAAMNSALEALGREPHSVVSYPHFIGRGARHLVESAMGPATVSEIDRGFELFQASYAQNLVVHTTVFAGLESALRQLLAHGVTLAVLSNKPDALTRRVVSRLFAGLAFSRVVGQRRGVAPKPDPGALEEIIERLGAGRERTVMVGDSPIDIRTARAAGVQSVGVLWSGGAHAAMIAAGADQTVASSGELIRALVG